jgi:cellulose synthase/poly-beta-1,6-N-acetylglucosamine synthase-like glycosyltransferase
MRYLLESDLLHGRDVNDVIIAVVDADGRLARSTLVEVAPYFRDPQVAAVQIGVRMYNADANRLARMQDMEFVIFTEIFQRSRTHTGSAGLGGNGQFARLAALVDLGPEPWSDYLTEDLDLGLRLLFAGWKTSFCPRTWVDQQAVTDMRRLLRQRTRWYQGHLQCWSRLPQLVKSDLSWRIAADLAYHLMVAVAMLLMGLYSVTVLGAIAVVGLVNPGKLGPFFTSHYGLPILVWYVAAFGLSWFYAWLYWMATPSMPFRKVIGFAHLYAVYTYIWVIAGVRAIYRMIMRKQGWAKTARTKDVAVTGSTRK